MLSEEERREIEAEFVHYPHRRAVCGEAMKIVQQHRGWVSDEALEDIADLLDMTVAELDGVATFFSVICRRPVGRHVVRLCDSISCWIMGYEQIRERFRARLGVGLGETTTDARFTVLPNVCLGACDRAPVMLVDEDLHTGLEPASIDPILERYA
jgi:NADH-quinone oxidoreductase subunit E